MLAYLDEFGATADLHGPIGLWVGEDQGTLALTYYDRLPQTGGQPDGVGPGRFVFVYTQPHRKHPGAHVSSLLVFPGPHPHEVVAVGRACKRLYSGGGGELDVLERRRPLGPPGDKGDIALYPDGNLAGRRTQRRNVEAFACQEPGCTDQRVAGERELLLWREDAQPALLGIFYEHRLGEAEVRRDPLAVIFGHLPAVEEDPQRVAAGAPVADEH